MFNKSVSQKKLLVISVLMIVFLSLIRFGIPRGERLLHRSDWGVLSESLLEDVQVLVLIAGFVFAVRLVRLAKELGWRIYFGLVAGGLFFIVGEEMSWGQHMFGWETPETFAEVNAQNETTLHNLDFFQSPQDFLLGFNFLFVAPVLVSLALGMLWIFPLLISRLQFLSPAVPGWGLSPLFLFSASFPVYYAAQESRLIASYVEVPWLVEVRDWEIGELGMYAGLALWLMSAQSLFNSARKD